jgi:hypothetical protein
MRPGKGLTCTAILIHFHQIREDETQVEYRFGFPEEMDRTLVIDKASRRGSPVDGTEDRTYAAALWKILQFERQRQTWPKAGSYAA